MTDNTIAYEKSPELREQRAVEGQIIMPFYIICDVSYSMKPDERELTEAFAQLVRDIQNDPVIEDLVMLSVITFNNQAQTVVPLSSPSEMQPITFSANGGTSYTAAFEEYNRAFEADRVKLKSQGIKVYRPCVFFLTDGGPNESDYLAGFRRLFEYDPKTKQGNRAFPYFVPFGFRDAPVDVIKSLAYPNFDGATRGRWFLSRQDKVSDVLKTIRGMLVNTVISSGQSAASGQPMIVAPTVAPGSANQFGDAEDWM